VKIIASLGVVVAVAVTLFYVNSKSPEQLEAEHQEWRRTAVEPVKVRPAYFDQMKPPADSEAVEVRMPASVPHKPTKTDRKIKK
jgi:hypothetical protein